MAKIYISAVPLTMVRTVDGSYRNVLGGDPIAGEAVQPEDLKRLVRKGFLVEQAEAVEKGSSEEFDEATLGTVGVAPTVKWVGDDKARAQQALEAEKTREGGARESLVVKLDKVLSA